MRGKQRPQEAVLGCRDDSTKGVITYGSITAWSKEGSQEAEEQEEVIRQAGERVKGRGLKH